MPSMHAALALALQLSLTLTAANAGTLNAQTQVNSTTPTKLQPVTAQQSAALAQLHSPQSTNIPIPLGAGLALTINYLGDPIPPDKVDEYLYYGTENVRRFLQASHANDPLRHDRWSYGDVRDVQIIVAANPGGTVTYAQLFAVLGGLREFMLRKGKEEARNLQFDLSVEGKGKVGFGLFWHDQSPTAVGGALRNATSLQLPTANSSLVDASLPLVAASERQWVPVPGTSLMLVFNFFGDPIPPAEYDIAFRASVLEIIEWIGHHGTWPIPHNRFEYDASDAHIVVIANRGIPVTWLELFQILQTLNGFVTGDPPHYQILHYEIYRGLDIVGFGLLWDNTPRVQRTAVTR